MCCIVHCIQGFLTISWLAKIGFRLDNPTEPRKKKYMDTSRELLYPKKGRLQPDELTGWVRLTWFFLSVFFVLFFFFSSSSSCFGFLTMFKHISHFHLLFLIYYFSFPTCLLTDTYTFFLNKIETRRFLVLVNLRLCKYNNLYII